MNSETYPRFLRRFISVFRELSGHEDIRLRAGDRPVTQLYNATPAIMHSLDDKGFIVSVSDRWLETLGYERTAVIGRRSTDFLTPASAARARNIVMPEFFEKGFCEDIPYEMVTSEGLILEVELSAVLERKADGSPLRTLAVIQDVTQKNAAERALAKTRQLLEKTAQIASVGGWEVDLKTGTIVWTKETRAIHGVSDDFVPNLESALDFYAPEARPAITDAVETAIASGSSWDLELPFLSADGRRKWVRAMGMVEFAGADAVRLSGTFQDITRRVLRERALKDANERIEIATESGNIGIWDADLEQGETFYSERWCNLIGYTREEISNSTATWLDFVHPDDKARAVRADQDHISGKTDHFEEQFRMLHKNGQWIWILDRGRVVEWTETGQPKRMIGTHTDITAQKSAELVRTQLARRMQLAADSGGIGIWEVDLASGKVDWDEWMYRLWGEAYPCALTPNDLFIRSVAQEDRTRIEAVVAHAVAHKLNISEEYRIRWSDGTIHTIRIAAQVIEENETEAERLVGAAWDVTSERNMAEQLAERAELMRVTLNSIGDAVITTDSTGIVEWLNPVAQHMTGWSTTDAKGCHIAIVFNIVNEDTRHAAPNPVMACLKSLEVVGLEENTVLVAKDGREFGVEDSAAPIRAEDGHVLGAVMVFHDVSEKRRMTREMRYRANHDLLTGLVNRSEFDRRLRTAYDEVAITGRSGALMYIDLDRFKVVNDSCGHTAGDQLLKTVSKMISDNVRSGDIVSRVGGDEFAVILEDCSTQSAAAIGQIICNQMDEFRFIHDEKRFRIGTSIGIAPIDPELGSLPVLQQGADAACFVAKESGRNRVHIWASDDESTAQHSQRLNWAARIEEALDSDRFELYAQSIVPLSGRPTYEKYEVLLRMRDSLGNIVSPGVFMPAAERFNLAGRLDRMVLRKVLKVFETMAPDPQKMILCVNLSGQSIGDRSFHRDVLNLLTDVGSDIRRSLCLEITETAAITNMADAINFASQVRALGVLVALDDFGAGASSFGYLRHLPADILKIDGQFIQGLMDDPLQEATVRSFIEVGRIMKLQIVAEYVSDADLADKLARMGVDFGQGFYFHRPEPLLQVMREGRGQA